MKKNGFTLIELLAVILILGIIALIAIPTVNGVIEQARKGAFENSVTQVISSIEQDCFVRELSGEKSIYEYIVNDGVFNADLDVKGGNLTDGKFILGDKTCSVTSYNVTDGNYAAYKSDSENDITVIKANDFTLYSDGTAVYFNPETNSSCTYEEYDDNLNNSYQRRKTGLKTGCMRWFTFLDDGSNKVNLILEHDTTPIVAYNLSGNNSVIKEAYEQLISDTKTWNPNLSVRFISASEVAKISNNTSFNELVSDPLSNIFYFGSNTNKISDETSNYAWLYDGMYLSAYRGKGTFDDNTYYEYFLNGESKRNAHSSYWTSSKTSDSNLVWIVHANGLLSAINCDTHDDNMIDTGIRPVITVYKSLIK